MFAGIVSLYLFMYKIVYLLCIVAACSWTGLFEVVSSKKAGVDSSKKAGVVSSKKAGVSTILAGYF